MSDNSEHYDPEIRPLKSSSNQYGPEIRPLKLSKKEYNCYSWLLTSIPKPDGRSTFVGCSNRGKSTIANDLITIFWVDPKGECFCLYFYLSSNNKTI